MALLDLADVRHSLTISEWRTKRKIGMTDPQHCWFREGRRRTGKMSATRETPQKHQRYLCRHRRILLGIWERGINMELCNVSGNAFNPTTLVKPGTQGHVRLEVTRRHSLVAAAWMRIYSWDKASGNVFPFNLPTNPLEGAGWGRARALFETETRDSSLHWRHTT